MNKPVTSATSKRNKNNAILRLGFVPLNDCAPLLVARELGFFEKHGLQVKLHRELGWATIRDKIIHGELDAAHALAGMPVAAALGLGSIKCECVSAMILSLHGNAITLSAGLRESGVRDASSLREHIRKARGQKIFTFGVVFPFSSHNFLLRQWLEKGGIDPEQDVRIVVVPPAHMVANLQSGNLHGYCVGEPWNSLAMERRAGWCVATSAVLAPGHPEKVLMVRRKFAEERANEHLALIAALIEACAFCDRIENAGLIAEILARPQYLNLPEELLGRSFRGGSDLSQGSTQGQHDFQIFHRNEANELSQETIAWIVRSVLHSGLVPDRSIFPLSTVRKIFRADIFAQAQSLITTPKIHEHQLTHA